MRSGVRLPMRAAAAVLVAALVLAPIGGPDENSPSADLSAGTRPLPAGSDRAPAARFRPATEAGPALAAGTPRRAVRTGVRGAGPILVVTDPADGFTDYLGQLLTAEGLPEYATTDAINVTAALLAGYRVVVLGSTALSGGQVAALSRWVGRGGTLVALRPRPNLDGLLGLDPSAGALSDGYLRIDTSRPPGAGLTAETIQYHGDADAHTARPGTQVVATLYGSPAARTPYAAVTRRQVGRGIAAAFGYDLGASVVATRQGDRRAAGRHLDGQRGPARPGNMFLNGWLDLDRVQIPQADEQQRLLANLVGQADLPLPRLWPLPRGLPAAVVLTGDGHPGERTRVRFDRLRAADPAGCSVKDWTCVRGTAYVSGPVLDPRAAAGYARQGFEYAAHVSSGCADYSAAGIARRYGRDLAGFARRYPGLPGQATTRLHCVAFSDWDSQPRAELAHGIRLDTNYYYWPASWVRNRPGLFTGSGMPMRFAGADGRPVDVYQAATQLTDESGQAYPLHIDTLLANATGPRGYHAVITANLHVDRKGSEHSARAVDAVLASARRHRVPVISARQLLDWLDAREATRLDRLRFSGGRLTFELADPAHNLALMIPARTSAGQTLRGVEAGGRPVGFAVRVVKGVRYAFVTGAAAGRYTARYS